MGVERLSASPAADPAPDGERVGGEIAVSRWLLGC